MKRLLSVQEYKHSKQLLDAVFSFLNDNFNPALHYIYSYMYLFLLQGFARQLSKTELRRPTIEKLLKKKEEDIGYFRDYITKDAIQKSLGMYLESLKNRRKW